MEVPTTEDFDGGQVRPNVSNPNPDASPRPSPSPNPNPNPNPNPPGRPGRRRLRRRWHGGRRRRRRASPSAAAAAAASRGGGAHPGRESRAAAPADAGAQEGAHGQGAQDEPREARQHAVCHRGLEPRTASPGQLCYSHVCALPCLGQVARAHRERGGRGRRGHPPRHAQADEAARVLPRRARRLRTARVGPLPVPRRGDRAVHRPHAHRTRTPHRRPTLQNPAHRTPPPTSTPPHPPPTSQMSPPRFSSTRSTLTLTLTHASRSSPCPTSRRRRTSAACAR